MRKPIIAGNWKMNKNIKEALEFVKEVGARADRDDVEAVICAPFLQLKDLKEATKGTKIKVGAQNMHFETSGAFTGEVSAEMLQEIGMDYVIIGHSERREYFGETDETVNKKVLKALQIGINPILCCGETLEQREAGVTKDHVKTQILAGLKDVTNEDLVKVGIASVDITISFTSNNECIAPATPVLTTASTPNSLINICAHNAAFTFPIPH